SLLALINQILDLSKIEAGKMELTLERVELPGLITSILESISPLAQEKGLRIETRFAPGLPAVEGDAARLKQVLINLLSNAVKFPFTVPAWATGQGAVTSLQRRPLRRPNQGLPGTAILVVDDDPSVRQLISRHLEQEGWKTVQASNATDALQLARESRPMLI